MNVYLFELRRGWKSALVWTLVILALLVLLMSVVYPIYYGRRAALEAALSGFPPAFSAAFGMSIAEVFSYGGFYAFGFLYLSLCGAIMAVTLGLGAFAREKRNKCTDFLLTKPLGRGRSFCAKLFSALTFLIAFNILYAAASLILYRACGHGEYPVGNAVLAAAAMLFTQLFFLSVAAAVAVFAKKVRTVSGTAVAAGFAAFILSALHSILKEDALRYIAPYKYFDVSLAFREGRFETPYVLTAAALTLALLAASFAGTLRRDVPAV